MRRRPEIVFMEERHAGTQDLAKFASHGLLFSTPAGIIVCRLARVALAFDGERTQVPTAFQPDGAEERIQNLQAGGRRNVQMQPIFRLVSPFNNQMGQFDRLASGFHSFTFETSLQMICHLRLAGFLTA